MSTVKQIIFNTIYINFRFPSVDFDVCQYILSGCFECTILNVMHVQGGQEVNRVGNRKTTAMTIMHGRKSKEADTVILMQ